MNSISKMSYNKLYSKRISKTGNSEFKKYIEFIEKVDEDGNKKYYVDIRTYFVQGKEEFATKIGVRLTVPEFEAILPRLKSLAPFEDEGDTRIITFNRDPRSEYVYKLKLRSVDDEDKTITITKHEINKIYFIRNKFNVPLSQ